MKSKFILSTLFAIMTCAGIASAQSGRLYVATDTGVFVPIVPSGSSPSMTLTAGEPVRIKIAGHIGTGKTMTGPGLSQINRMQVPCAAGGGASGQQQVHPLSKVKNIYMLASDKSWRGTCQMLTLKVRDDLEYRVKIRFQ